MNTSPLVALMANPSVLIGNFIVEPLAGAAFAYGLVWLFMRPKHGATVSNPFMWHALGVGFAVTGGALFRIVAMITFAGRSAYEPAANTGAAGFYMMLVPAIFAAGYIAWFKKTRGYPEAKQPHRAQGAIPKPTAPIRSNNDAYATALSEIEEGRLDKGVWARSFAESGGDESKAKAAYIKARAESIQSAAVWVDTRPPGVADAGVTHTTGNSKAGANGSGVPMWVPIVFGAVPVIGIVAAIALPAYQDYPSKALWAEGLTAYQNKDYAGALAKWQPLADKGMADAQFRLGWMFSDGIGVQKDQAQAANWYRKAATQGHAIAQNNIGVMYASGDGVPKDGVEAVSWYRKAAEQGSANAQHLLGRMYASGDGVHKDEAEAVDWYRKAVAQGSANAQFSLSIAYENGQGVPEDMAEALSLRRKAATQGLAIAQLALGLNYANGLGVQKDETEAVNWYRKAATQGFGYAQSRLAECYANGRGVPKDYFEAANWARKAAEQGDANAQRNLGWMYTQGLGVQKNLAEAVRWLLKAAEQGNVDAQYMLGEMHSVGLGVQEDDAEAVSWFRKAAAQGNVESIAELQKRGLR